MKPDNNCKKKIINLTRNCSHFMSNCKTSKYKDNSRISQMNWYFYSIIQTNKNNTNSAMYQLLFTFTELMQTSKYNNNSTINQRKNKS